MIFTRLKPRGSYAPTRSPRLRGLFRAHGYGTPQRMLRKRENDITRTRAGARLSGFAACRKLSMWRATRATPCLIALALARFPLSRSPRLFPLLAIRAKSTDTARPPYSFFLSLFLRFIPIAPSFSFPLLSIFPSSLSVALSLSPRLNLSLFVLQVDMLSSRRGIARQENFSGARLSRFYL